MFKSKRGLISLGIAVIIIGIVAGVLIFNNGNREQNNTKTAPENSNQQSSPEVGVDQEKERVEAERLKAEEIAAKKLIGPRDVKVRAVYLSGDSAGIPNTINHIIELSKTTEVNAVVIDVKESGIVNYPSNVALVKEINASQKRFDVDEVIKKLHENNIYVIGRVVCFRDSVLAVKRPDLAVKRPDGQVWADEGNFKWTNPYKEEVWKYNIDIAKEAIEKGFDEIQFDYVRFPAAPKSKVVYGSNALSKTDTIKQFLENAMKVIHDEKGITLSADIFAIAIESPTDGEGIGQAYEKIGKTIDYISPMIYPSHYANNSKSGAMANGVGQTVNNVLFTKPDLEPYKVVYHSLITAKNRASEDGSFKAKIRPYLQAFTATYLPKGYYQKYGAEQIRQQIKAVYDAGYEEWILWDPSNIYPEGAFEKK